MNIFGIGPLEIAFILILVIIIFGPKDIVKTSRTIGKSLNRLVHSDTWKVINRTSQELKNLPNRLMQEAGVDEIKDMAKLDLPATEHTILPPGSLPGTQGKSGTPTATVEPSPIPSTDALSTSNKNQVKPTETAKETEQGRKE
jgi:Sec-independent protein translocase protein TatA